MNKNNMNYSKKINLALSLWVKLARANATFAKLSTENIRSFGLTDPQFGVIECIGHLGPLTLGELTKKMLVTGGNITCVIDNLEKENLVKRIRSKKDRRITTVQLTTKGSKLFKDKFKLHAQYIANMTSVLTETEQSQLATLLKKLGLSLQAQFPERINQGA
ncbi:MAG: winged helix-turn-helix transcriptional regulator [Ignavibacteriales bacterium]|nr:winged helix-turn-helix transcriptional regulator [Ignavibacteriales bacterium]